MRSFTLLLLSFFAAHLAQAGFTLAWPTPNPAFAKGEGISGFVQPTVSGEDESALFGCVRNNGRRFHEGLDLRPIEHDSRGEAADPIFAAMDGVVRHVNGTRGKSNYGRYIVLEHPDRTPAIYTLYAHLASVADGITEGTRVVAGQKIATMGRSATGYTIPRSRAHLHFEIGFRYSDKFQNWYDRQRFGNDNEHGNFNGMNLGGIDPLDFYEVYRSGDVQEITDYLRTLKPAYAVRIRYGDVPWYVKQYPALVTRDIDESTLAGWEIGFTWWGLPLVWTPLDESGLGKLQRTGQAYLTRYDAEQMSQAECRNALAGSRESPRLGSTTEHVLALLFQP